MKRKWGVLAAAGAVMAAVLVGASLLSSRNSNLEALAKEYQAAGMPWTLRDLPQPAVGKESDNSAPLIRRALKAWPDSKGLMVFGHLSEPKDQREAAQLLEKTADFEPALQLAMKAGRKAFYDPGWDWDKDLNKVVPELQGIRMLVRALCQKSGAYLLVGDRGKAIESWKAALTLTLHSRTLPDSSAALLAAAMSASVSRAAEKAMDQKPKDAELLSVWAKGLESLDSEPDWRMAVRSDAYAYLATLRNSVNKDDAAGRLLPGYEEPRNQKSAVVREGVPKSAELREMTRGVLRTYAALGDAIRLNNSTLPETIQLAEKLEDQAGSGGKTRSRSSLSRSLRKIGASMGHAKAARALALMLLVRAKERREAAALQDLPGGPWIDPLSGLPLKLSYRKERIKIWSVGSNLIDDGGLSREEASLAMQADQPSRTAPLDYDEVAAFPISVSRPESQSRAESPHDRQTASRGRVRAVRAQALLMESDMGAFAPGLLGIRRTTGLEGSL